MRKYKFLEALGVFIMIPGGLLCGLWVSGIINDSIVTGTMPHWLDSIEILILGAILYFVGRAVNQFGERHCNYPHSSTLL